jgi:hypothetical protein
MKVNSHLEHVNLMIGQTMKECLIRKLGCQKGSADLLMKTENILKTASLMVKCISDTPDISTSSKMLAISIESMKTA